MKTGFATALSALAISGTASLAGTYTPPPAGPVPAPVYQPAGPDWTGFYAGVQAGYADVGTNVPGVSGDGFIGGLHIGYDHDFGQFVAGAAFDYDWTDITLLPPAVVAIGGIPVAVPGLKLERVWRLKLRGGVELGSSGLAYLTGGYANARTDTLGSEDGYSIGLGYEHRVNENFSVGAELLYHEFDNFSGTALDMDVTTFELRGSYRF